MLWGCKDTCPNPSLKTESKFPVECLFPKTGSPVMAPAGAAKPRVSTPDASSESGSRPHGTQRLETQSGQRLQKHMCSLWCFKYSEQDLMCV